MWRALAAGLLLSLPAAVSGQVCQGRAPLGAVSTINLWGDASSFEGGRVFGAGATVGSTFFVSGGFSLTGFSEGTLSSKQVSAGAGFQRQVGESGAEVCGSLEWEYDFGVDVSGPGPQYLPGGATSWLLAPAISAGVRSALSPALELVWFGAISVIGEREALAATVADSRSLDAYGRARLGVSLLINKTLSLRSALSIPVGLDGGSNVLGVGASVALGG